MKGQWVGYWVPETPLGPDPRYAPVTLLGRKQGGCMEVPTASLAKDTLTSARANFTVKGPHVPPGAPALVGSTMETVSWAQTLWWK